MFRSICLFFVLFSISLFTQANNQYCADNEVPFCELPIEQRLELPESILHDIPVGIFAKPQTDIFLDKPLEVVRGIRDIYPQVDINNEINPRPLELALSYYHHLKGRLKKTEFLGVINYKDHSSIPRFFLINMKSGKVEKLLVAHGEGSDPNNTGYADKFSNIVDSHQSSIGAFITAETYNGKSGYSLRIDGIEPSNSKIRTRAIVIHGSKYVKPELRSIGRSWGCPAVDNRISTNLIDRIKGGTLFFSWYDQ